IEEIYVDDAMRKALERLGGTDRLSLRDGLHEEIERLAQIAKPIDGARGGMLAAPADCASGASGKLPSQVEDRPEAVILVTGRINPQYASGPGRQKRPGQNHALERASAPLRHGRTGEGRPGENSDPSLLRSQPIARAHKRARAGARDDGWADRVLAHV